MENKDTKLQRLINQENERVLESIKTIITTLGYEARNKEDKKVEDLVPEYLESIKKQMKFKDQYIEEAKNRALGDAKQYIKQASSEGHVDEEKFNGWTESQIIEWAEQNGEKGDFEANEAHK